jgi:ribosomal-protein-alanine N-acetyltransferase
MSVEIRAAVLADLPAILDIERASFSIPWTQSAIEPELRADGRHFPMVAVEDETVVAFALAWSVADEMHLVNFAVDPPRRREGVGRRLLRELVALARERGLRMLTLEVRDGNEAARELYRREGFVEVALRPGYYPDTREDAVIMLLPLEGRESGT